jgi:hypothetical protein
MIHAHATTCECGKECVPGFLQCARCIDNTLTPLDYAELSYADSEQRYGEEARGVDLEELRRLEAM